MATKINLYRISVTHFEGTLEGEDCEISPKLLTIIKNHQGKQSQMFGQFLIPRKTIHAFIDKVNTLKQFFEIKDFSGDYIEKLLSCKTEDFHENRQTINFNQLKRFLLLDPLVIERYNFIAKYISERGTVKFIFRENPRNILFVCDGKILKQWMNVVKDQGIYFRHYYARAQESTKVRQQLVITYLSHEDLQKQIGFGKLSKQTLKKFTSIIIDDYQSELVHQKLTDKGLQNILSSINFIQIDIIFVFSNIPIWKPDLIFEIANILRPWQYGKPDTMNPSTKENVNNASWIKECRYPRELWFILISSTILIDCSPHQQSFKEKKILYPQQKYITDQISTINNTFKEVGPSQILSIVGQQWKKQNPYIQRLMQVYFRGKLKVFADHIDYLVNNLKNKTVVLLSNNPEKDQIISILQQRQIQYLIYSINKEKSQDHQFNTSHHKVCIIVCDNLVQSFKRYQRKKNQGQLITKKLQLQRIYNVKQILILTMFWRTIDQIRQEALENILFNQSILQQKNLLASQFKSERSKVYVFFVSDQIEDQLVDQYLKLVHQFKQTQKKMTNHQNHSDYKEKQSNQKKSRGKQSQGLMQKQYRKIHFIQNEIQLTQNGQLPLEIHQIHQMRKRPKQKYTGKCQFDKSQENRSQGQSRKFENNLLFSNRKKYREIQTSIEEGEYHQIKGNKLHGQDRQKQEVNVVVTCQRKKQELKGSIKVAPIYQICHHPSNSHADKYCLSEVDFKSSVVEKKGDGGFYNFVLEKIIPLCQTRYSVEIISVPNQNAFIGFCTQEGLGKLSNFKCLGAAYYYCQDNGQVCISKMQQKLENSGATDGDIVECVSNLVEGKFWWEKEGRRLYECNVPNEMQGKPLFFSLILYQVDSIVKVSLK